MPYLPTSQEYLEQSCLLLEAYPETTRITTKYSFPSKPSTSSSTKQNAASQSQPQQQSQQPPATAAPTPIATLTLKTFNPTSGICLKYQTNKIQEVGRLMTTLGKLAAGSDVAGLGLSNPVPAAAVPGGGDTEMVDAPVEEAANATAGKGEGAKGGKGKKKGGKGKR